MAKEEFLKILKKLTNTDETDDCSDEMINSLTLDAFNRLSDSEKVSLLRRLNRNIDTTEETVNEIVQHLTNKNRPSVEDLNQMELIRLKSWLIKTITIAAMFCFLIFTALMIYVNGKDGGGDFSSYFSDFMKIINLVLLNKS